MTLYDTIGKGYNNTRRADPYIAGRLYELLHPRPGGRYLDIGCGTGNYLEALSKKGLSFYGVDPSATMLDAARRKDTGAELLQASAEDVDLPDAFFDGCVAVLTFHHWVNRAQGLKEIKRLLKPGAGMVLFSFTPEQVQQYWLQHYFPLMIEKCLYTTPALNDMKKLFYDAGFTMVETEPYFVHPALQDLFMYAGKHAPERYLDTAFRDGISAFRTLISNEELEEGLARLSEDIRTNAIQEVMRRYDNDDGDYIFFIARA